MTIVIYIGAALFLILALGLMLTWWRGRHPGAILLALTYLMAGALAVWMDEWWPLITGFLSAWALRLMGLDPGFNPDGKTKTE